MTGIALGFLPEPLLVPMAQILPCRKVPVGLATSRKFLQIRSSIEEVGLIEPLSVTGRDSKSGQHLLLDGHVRLIALRDLGHDAAPCLIATDDEAYTYNNRLNRLSTIQEHFMIRRAVDRGVSPERLAKALSVDVSHITKKLNLLEGICPEAVELFKDRQFSAELGRVIRRMKPTRQVECVELMVSANNLTVGYAEPRAFLRDIADGDGLIRVDELVKRALVVDLIGAARVRTQIARDKHRFFKAEITRLARRELRIETEPLKKYLASHRSDIAALKKQVRAQEIELKRLARGASSRVPEPNDEPSQVRFRPDGMKSHRQKLGLSAKDYGLLIGASALSVYIWISTAIARIRCEHQRHLSYGRQRARRVEHPCSRS